MRTQVTFRTPRLLNGAQTLDAKTKTSTEPGNTSHVLSHRSFNERTILQLIRDNGPMPKAEIARATNLSAQAVSVIINRLLDLDLLQKESSQKGKVGQPSTPIALCASGVYSIGVKIGRQSTQVLLVDFTGQVQETRKVEHAVPIVDQVLNNVTRMTGEIISPDISNKVVGIGIAQPFRLDEWSDELGIEPAVLDEWAITNVGDELEARLNRPTYSINDATAACLAEMVASPNAARANFLHIYIGTFVGGGLVIDGKLHQGLHGNAAALGSQLVCVEGATGPQQLISVASRFHLERDLRLNGVSINSDQAANSYEFENWVKNAASGLAQTIISSTALVELDSVVIDSSLPGKLLTNLVTATNQKIAQLKTTGIVLPHVEQGTLGAIGSGLGGALLPICTEFTTMND